MRFSVNVTVFLAAAATAFAPTRVRLGDDLRFVPALLAPSQLRPVFFGLKADSIGGSSKVPATWSEVQAEYRRAVDWKHCEGLEIIRATLDSVMDKSFDDAKTAIARLNEAANRTIAGDSTDTTTRDSDKPSNTTEPAMIPAGNCRPLLKQLVDMIDWPSNSNPSEPFYFKLFLENDKGRTIFGDPVTSKEDLKVWLSRTAKKRAKSYQLCITRSESLKYFRLDRSDISFNAAKAELEQILIFLGLKQKSKKELLQNSLAKTFEGKIDGWYYPELVTVEKECLAFQSKSKLKQSAVVVSGESGGGKSQYALHLKERTTMDGEPFDAALYLSLSDHETQVTADNGPPPLSDARLPPYTFLRNCLIPYLNMIHVEECSGFFDILTELNVDRNDWAVKTLKQILSLRMESEVREWMNTVNCKPELKRLLLVIDEVGLSLEFTHGLIDSVRTLHQSVFSSQAESVGLVLCGAGIEDVTCSGLAASHPTLGTDPSKSFITMIGQPDLAAFKTLTDASKPDDCVYWDNDIRDKLSYCMEQDGSRAQIMSTNMRLLRCGILPALTSCIVLENFKAFDDIDQYAKRLESHFMKIQACGAYMEFVVRKYVSLNGLKSTGTARRSTLLKHAFLYSLLKSMEVAIFYLTTVSQQSAEAYQNVIDIIHSKLTVQDIKAVMTFGLVTSDPTKTSPAMKYFACEGFSLSVLPGEGKQFESLVESHLYRFYSSLGCIVSVHTLNLQVPQHMQNVTEVDSVFNRVKEEKNTTNVFILLQPRENNAAGPDIMVLDMTAENDHQLDLYQVKHLKNPSGFDTAKVQKSLFCLPACRNNAEAVEKRYNAKIRSRFLQLLSQASAFSTI